MIYYTHQLKTTLPSTCYPTELSLVKTLCTMLNNPQIVEFGTLCGSLTEAMLAGLGGRGQIDAFDYFVYSNWMDHLALKGLDGQPLIEGQSFRHLFKLEAPNLIVHEHDLTVLYPWDKLIDLMVVDGFKSEEICRVTAPEFFPHLKVGSQIFDQDFAHNHQWYTWAIKLYYGLRNYLTMTAMCCPGTGVLLRVDKTIPKGLVEDICRFDEDYNKCLSFYLEAFNPDRTGIPLPL